MPAAQAPASSTAPSRRRCWYTADLHLGHEAIIPFCGRPFRSAAHMDSVLIENLWEKVGPEDALWVVGDFAFGPRAKDPEWLATAFAQLPGAERHLVVGNHDGAATQALPWDSVSLMAEAHDPHDPRPVALCHYPMITWPGARKGALHLFGHVHLGWAGSRGAVNVGVDQWNYRPVRISDAARRAAKLPYNKHWGDVEHGAKGTGGTGGEDEG